MADAFPPFCGAISLVSLVKKNKENGNRAVKRLTLLSPIYYFTVSKPSARKKSTSLILVTSVGDLLNYARQLEIC